MSVPESLLEGFGLEPVRHNDCGGFLTSARFVGLVSVRCARCRRAVLLGSDGRTIFEALTFDPPPTLN